jgi:hypothetical protein
MSRIFQQSQFGSIAEISLLRGQGYFEWGGRGGRGVDLELFQFFPVAGSSWVV